MSGAALLDDTSLATAVAELTAGHAYFASIVRRHGPPPLWRRPPGFATLVSFILEQQVSLASARAAYARLEDAVGDVSPRAFLTLGAEELRAIGFSRQKAAYATALAAGLTDGTITIPGHGAGDEAARASLLAIRGVGPWTAECYLLFVLGRPDAWPSGDRALQVAMGGVLDLAAVPTPRQADSIAEEWRPLRAAAARLLWHHYLSREP